MRKLFRHVAIVEAGEATLIEELIASGFGRFVVRQLSPTAIVVDHERLPEIQRQLKRLGQTPRVVAE